MKKYKLKLPRIRAELQGLVRLFKNLVFCTRIFTVAQKWHSKANWYSKHVRIFVRSKEYATSLIVMDASRSTHRHITDITPHVRRYSVLRTRRVSLHRISGHFIELIGSVRDIMTQLTWTDQAFSFDDTDYGVRLEHREQRSQAMMEKSLQQFRPIAGHCRRAHLSQSKILPPLQSSEVYSYTTNWFIQ